MSGSRGGATGGPDPPLKNHKNIGFLCNTCLDPLKNHKATKPAFNVGPSSACQGNAISRAICWRADDGPFLRYLDPISPHQLKKQSNLDPPLTKLSGSVHDL